MLQALTQRVSRGLRDTGTLKLQLPDGEELTVGHGQPTATLRFDGRKSLLRVLQAPELAFGEAYMRGEWEPQDASLEEVMRIALGIGDGLRARQPAVLRSLLRLRARLQEWNHARRAQRNVAHHYDIGTDVYRRFLDAGMHYSCAYFENENASLEAAQEAKCRHIARKLALRPGARVLDIGCGFGAMAMHLARHHGARVIGITLSRRQLEVARERAREADLQEQVQFLLQDYRELEDRFDAIVSIGMFEHVGRPQYPVFFRHLRRMLADDGVAVLHSIGRLTPPGATNPWIRRYIFPGGYIPALSEVLPHVERQGLLSNDLEIWRLHYARTLAEWHRRFTTHEADIRQQMGERFCRMWRFYLQSSEAAFRCGGLMVFQLQLSRQIDRLPLSRRYLYA